MTSRREFLQYSAGAVAAMALPQTTPSPGQDLLPLTVAEAGRRIASKQLSPVELTRQTLARIETLNPKTGAFITVSADQAMDAARTAEREIMQGKYRGPMHGIPFGAKDTYYTQGIRTTAGSYVLRDHYPTFDCTIVRKLKEAGGILVGKTNLPEFSFGGVTPGCHNPWDLARNSGGSSGGSGSALAASMLIAATGGDTSGSIRNPSSTNGVVGIKPTFGLVSRYGVVPISWTLDHLGPMARTVEDVAIMLKIIAGPDPMDQFSARVAAQDYPQQLKRSIRGLRVGVLSQAEMKGFHPDTQKAFFDAVKVLESQGAQIKEVTFTENTHVAAESHGIIRICEAATYHRQYLRKQEAEYRHIWSNDLNDSNTRITVEAGMLLTSAQYLKAQQARKLFMQEFYKIYNTLDVFLDPTMPSPADVPAPGAEGYRNWFDLNGFPAVSIPCGFSTNPRGLPVGLQISAKPFQDSLVLAVANAFETATEWHKRRPAI
jgi:aspartyl-tRNA(Asn)/glutamyl-tRNA(Gln) amidotransferase subunit A